MDTIGTRVKKVRTINKMKQKDFAERLFVSTPYVSMVENDKEQPTDMLLKLIALDFNVSFYWLKDGSGTMAVGNEYDYFERNNMEEMQSKISDEIQVLDNLLEKNSSSSEKLNTRTIFQALGRLLENKINNSALTTLIYEQIANIIIESCDFVDDLNNGIICPKTVGELYKRAKIVSDSNYDCIMEITILYENMLFNK